MSEKTNNSSGSQGVTSKINPGNFKNDPSRAAAAGRKGGVAAQRSGNAHRLTNQERSVGGSKSGGNFKNDPTRAMKAGQRGGRA